MRLYYEQIYFIKHTFLQELSVVMKQAYTMQLS